MPKKFTVVVTLILTLIVGVYLTLTIKRSALTVDEVNLAVSPPASASISRITDASAISPISINYLRTLVIDSAEPVIESTLPAGSNYTKYLASYLSEGNKIYGLLAVPNSEMPEGGFPAIVFNHGYIPPTQYVTTSGYVAYVDYLARNGFVVFKIDYRGNGESEGEPSGSYFSPGYMIDAISALKSLQKHAKVNPERIGMWGHSMAGNLVLRALLTDDDVKAGVIWAGAVYSYQDFAKYRISDNSYVRRPEEPREGNGAQQNNQDQEVSLEVQKLRSEPETVDFNSAFWKSVSLTQSIKYLSAPLQIHHAVNDLVVNIGYSRDLEKVLQENAKEYEFYEYSVGGHNIESPSFDLAMQRTVKFFKDHL